MAWPKIKNIIILILLVTNLGLLTFTASREVRSRQLQDEARSDAIAFLQQKGIELDGDQVPRTMTLQPMLVTRDVEREGVLAAALLEGDRKSTRLNSSHARPAISYAVFCLDRKSVV